MIRDKKGFENVHSTDKEGAVKEDMVDVTYSRSMKMKDTARRVVER